MRNLWRGEVVLKQHFHQEQGDYVLDKHFTKIQSIDDKLLEPVYSDHYRQRREMSSIVGTYQHERNENLDECLKAVGMLKAATNNECAIPYDGSKNKYNL
ncbi:hypothetical protein ANTPLA_LOCUS10598 [Anthophora plagiata]